MFPRLLTALLAATLCWNTAAFAQTAQGAEDEAVFLVANPSFRDADYRHAVLIAAPIPSGGHVGVIINRPTNRSLTSLFPEHEPSKRVAEPVHYGGPFSRGALVALVKTDISPGGGTQCEPILFRMVAR